MPFGLPQGMRNNVLNFALLFETFIAAAVVYIPPPQHRWV